MGNKKFTYSWFGAQASAIIKTMRQVPSKCRGDGMCQQPGIQQNFSLQQIRRGSLKC